MNAAEYAKHRGISKMRVSQYIAQGKISATKIGRGYEIDPEVADRELAGSIDQRSRNATPPPSPPPKPKPVAIDKPLIEPEQPPAPLPEPARPARPAKPSKPPREPIAQPMQGGPTYAEAQRAREVYRAERERLKLLQEKGELVSAADVKSAAFQTARTVRDALMALPDRLSAQLAATTDARLCHNLLTEELRVALRSIADG